jgi:aminoglycoside 2'-N-acetyltransferase I
MERLPGASLRPRSARGLALGVRPTPDEQGGVLVLEGAVPLELDGELTCDWRDGDVW